MGLSMRLCRTLGRSWLGGSELVIGMRILVVDALDSRPLVKLVAYLVRFHGPAVSTDLRHDLVIVLQAPVLCTALKCLSIKHKGIHRTLYLARLLSLMDLPESSFHRSIDICFNVKGYCLPIVRHGAQWLLKFPDPILLHSVLSAFPRLGRLWRRLCHSRSRLGNGAVKGAVH